MEDDESLNADEDINPEELADILHDAEQHRIPQQNLPEDAADPDPEVASDSDVDDPELCEPNEEDKTSINPPSLVSEPEGRPQRSGRAPERYSPATGTSYRQVKREAYHNLVAQAHPKERTL